MQKCASNARNKRQRFRLILGTCITLSVLQFLPVSAYASALICLDFDGHTIKPFLSYGEVRIPAYDSDGSPQVLSAQEALEVRRITAIVREDFSPFDIDIAVEGAAEFWYRTRIPSLPNTY